MSHNLSFGLIRTNPKLSGNVKITVDSNEDIWLNSFDANTELSNTSFKKFRLKPNGFYPHDLYNFFLNGSLPKASVFQLYQTEISKGGKKDLSQQYDMFYTYGAQALNSKFYDEEVSLFAPIWIKNQLPRYFVIYRVPGPTTISLLKENIRSGNIISGNKYKLVGNNSFSINYNGIIYTNGNIFEGVQNELGVDISSYTILQSSENDKIILFDENNYFEDITDPLKLNDNILKHGQLIKTFDLTENSKIGKYIRNIKNSPLFPESPLAFNFGKENLTHWKGISYKDGSFASKGEFLYDYIKKDRNLIEFEDFITQGFERNGLICANLLNLEFLFTDMDVDNWSINRYYGFYVDDIKTGSFLIDGESLKSKSSLIGQTPSPKVFQTIDSKFEGSFIQTNQDGVVLWGESINGNFPKLEGDLNQPEFWWIKDKSNSFHNIKPFSDPIINDNIKKVEIKLAKNRIDIGNLTGFGDIKIDERGFRLKEKGKASIILDVKKPFIGYVNNASYGEFIDINIGFCTLKIMANPVQEWKPGQAGDSFIDLKIDQIPSDWNPIMANYNVYLNWFHPGKTAEHTAKGIANAINAYELKILDAYAIGTKVYILTKSIGSSGNNFFISLNDKILSNTSNNKFIGGTENNSSRIKIPFKSGIEDNIYVKTTKDFSKILNLSPYLDEPIFENGKFIEFKDIDKYSVLNIEDLTENIILTSQERIVGYKLWENKVGVFSLYSIKDFDFNFHGSIYNKTMELEIQKYFASKQNTKNLIPELVKYIVEGDGVIEYVTLNGEDEIIQEYFTGETFIRQVETNSYFRIKSGTPTIRPIIFKDEKNINEFLGFNTLIDKFTTSTSTEPVKKWNEILLKNEYEYLRENSNKNLVLKSRVVPYINKWVFLGGTDIRNNPYRLNTHNAFGENNFSPSFVHTTPNATYFTHEWYYLDNIPLYSDPKDLETSSNYFQEKINKSKLFDITQDYFSKYFKFDRIKISDNSELFINPEERWTQFTFNRESGFVETLFRGSKVRVKKIKNINSNEIIKDDKSFNDYKFAVILTTKKRKQSIIEAPITYEIIENKKWKTITFVITTIIEDYKFNSDFLYETKNPDLDTDAFNKLSGLSYSKPSFQAFVDYLGLYTLEDKRDIAASFDEGLIFDSVEDTSDVWLSFGINLDSPSSFDITTKTNNIEVVNKINWPVNAYEEILKNAQNKFSEFIIPSLYNNFGKDFIIKNMISIKSNDFIKLNQVNNTLAETNPTFPITSISAGSTSIRRDKWATFPVKYIKGGKGFYKEFIKKLSFGFIKDLINNNSNLITYKSISETGTETTPDFKLFLVEPDLFKKETEFIPEQDLDKPNELQLYNNIGTIVTERNSNNIILRYGGSYEPLFKDLIMFKTKDGLEENRITLNLSTKFGKINDFYFHKVANNDIMKLAKNNKYDSLYPLIGETPIDKKDSFIWQSNWDSGYYQFYRDAKTFNIQNGTRQMIEQKSFLGSKVMKTPEKISIPNFISKEVEDINTFIISNLGNSEAIWSINNNELKLRVFTDKRILRWMRENGADKEFIKNILPEFSSGDLGSINDDIENYLKINILDLYNITHIDFYIKTFNQADSLNLKTVESEFLTIEKIKKGYIKRDNFNKDSISKWVFDISIPLRTDMLSSIGVEFSIKRI